MKGRLKKNFGKYWGAGFLLWLLTWWIDGLLELLSKHAADPEAGFALVNPVIQSIVFLTFLLILPCYYGKVVEFLARKYFHGELTSGNERG